MTEQERFDRCLGAVLRLEGGYADDGRDPGGPTNLGVTLGVLSEALGRPATARDVRALTPAAVAPIYRRRYWDAIGGAALAPGPDLMAFDAAVNMGLGAAARMLQAALGVRPDGIVGPRTLAAASGAEPARLILGIGLERDRRYRGLARFDVFGAGWIVRLRTVQALALAWAAAPPEPEPATAERRAAA